MKHTTKQFLYGLFPLAVGTVCNYCILYLPVSMILFNLLYLATWGYLCYRFTIPEQNPFVQTIRICLPGLCMLALVLYQELVLTSYFPGLLGLAGQFFFLPGMSVFGIFVTPFVDTLRPYHFFIVEYLGMCLICLFACHLRIKRK